eukprot:m51a1_g10815 hypothetical protein (239) ;mRNA; f:41536-42369
MSTGFAARLRRARERSQEAYEALGGHSAPGPRRRPQAAQGDALAYDRAALEALGRTMRALGSREQQGAAVVPWATGEQAAQVRRLAACFGLVCTALGRAGRDGRVSLRLRPAGSAARAAPAEELVAECIGALARKSKATATEPPAAAAEGDEVAPLGGRPLWEDEANVGNRLLRKLGWSGGGLGKDGSGIREPVRAHKRARRVGIGLGAPTHTVFGQDNATTGEQDSCPAHCSPELLR